jgi:hypothetical protein
MKPLTSNFIFSAEQIIESNLNLQSIQRSLKNDFGILNPTLKIFSNPNFVKNYQCWDESKKNKFIKTIGGQAAYKKIKSFLEKIENKENI